MHTERLGEPVEVPTETHGAVAEGAGSTGGGAGRAVSGVPWRAGLAPALLGGGLAVLLAALTGTHGARRSLSSRLVLQCALPQGWRWRGDGRRRRACAATAPCSRCVRRTRSSTPPSPASGTEKLSHHPSVIHVYVVVLLLSFNFAILDGLATVFQDRE